MSLNEQGITAPGNAWQLKTPWDVLKTPGDAATYGMHHC
jgi:hypothetical protein